MLQEWEETKHKESDATWKENVIPAELLHVGGTYVISEKQSSHTVFTDVIKIRGGESITADGVVCYCYATGSTASGNQTYGGGAVVDESMFTGESRGVTKNTGDKVSHL